MAVDPVWDAVARGSDRGAASSGGTIGRRVIFFDVRGALAVLVATLVTAQAASADTIDDEARQLASAPGYKRRLAAVLALSKSHDGRAVRALAAGLRADKEVQIRRVAALALGKAVDDTTPKAARDDALAALTAAASDKDAKTRELAARSLAKVAALARPAAPPGNAPQIYVHLGDGTDLSSKAPRDALPRLVRSVKTVLVKRTPGIGTEWPGAAPTAKQLADAGARAFVVAPTISALAVQKKGNQAEVACTVSVRIAPWAGTDGSEKWTAQRAASASGSGKAITSGDAASIAGGMRDCVLAVGEEVTASQVVPFLRKLIGDS